MQDEDGTIHAVRDDSPGKGPVRRRPYRDGVELSLVGMGGMTVVGMEQADANRLIEESIDRGVNYFDVAPTYGDSELKYGVALQGHRDSVFLSCKTTKRDAEGARQQLEDSLTRLRTDHVDLYQFHGVSTMEDVAQILAPGGAAEAFLKAREQGKTRFLGFSTHDEDAATALMDGFACDSVLMPVNFVCFEQGGFGPKLLQAAAERRVARHCRPPRSVAWPGWPSSPSRCTAAGAITDSSSPTAGMSPSPTGRWRGWPCGSRSRRT